ncbi:MAG: alpha/beta hydrolase [Sedimentitalea sp.]|uniref:alpha/beta hydrolase n=1 Tax=Sedimentitalea sp. TaxID=2048915 RepID=UPI003264C9A3
MYRTNDGEVSKKQSSDEHLGFEEIIAEWIDWADDRAGEHELEAGERSRATLDHALYELKDQNWAGAADLKLQSMLTSFPYAAFVIVGTGRILRMNEAASTQFDVLPDDPIEATELLTTDGRSLSEVLSFGSDDAGRPRVFKLIDATRPGSVSDVMLASVPTKLVGLKSQCSLVFVLENTVTKTFVEQFGSYFDLTKAEAALLYQFTCGKALVTIADESGKSIKTLRTQFHAVMGKVGVRRQADLMARVLTMSHFLDRLGPIATTAAHPNRKRVEMLRPGPRSVEVFLAGDLRGDVVVLVPNVTMRTFPADMEDAFRQAGLCIATICRPGYGGTDPAFHGQSTRQCFADDVRAVLDQLNVSQVRLLAQNTACGFAVGLAVDLPGRVREILMVSAMPPKPYLTVQTSNSKLSAAFIRARNISPKLFRLLMYLSIRAWKIGGVQRVHGRQMAPYLPDLEILKQPHISAEFDNSMRARFAQDLDQVGDDFEMAISDWTSDLRLCRAPITILHGAQDQAVAISDINSLCADFPERIALFEVSDAGFMLPYSHRSEFISGLRGVPG